jgi:hypothetical protein
MTGTASSSVDLNTHQSEEGAQLLLVMPAVLWTVPMPKLLVLTVLLSILPELESLLLMLPVEVAMLLVETVLLVELVSLADVVLLVNTMEYSVACCWQGASVPAGRGDGKGGAAGRTLRFPRLPFRL